MQCDFKGIVFTFHTIPSMTRCRQATHTTSQWSGAEACMLQESNLVIQSCRLVPS